MTHFWWWFRRSKMNPNDLNTLDWWRIGVGKKTPRRNRWAEKFNQPSPNDPLDCWNFDNSCGTHPDWPSHCSMECNFRSKSMPFQRSCCDTTEAPRTHRRGRNNLTRDLVGGLGGKEIHVKEFWRPLWKIIKNVLQKRSTCWGPRIFLKNLRTAFIPTSLDNWPQFGKPKCFRSNSVGFVWRQVSCRTGGWP